MKPFIAAIGVGILAFMPGPADPKIFSAIDDGSGNVTIEGRRLGQAQYVELGGDPLTIVSNTTHEIVAELPANLAPGNYRLEVKTLDPQGVEELDAITYVQLPETTDPDASSSSAGGFVNEGGSLTLGALQQTYTIGSANREVVITLDGDLQAESGTPMTTGAWAEVTIILDGADLGGGTRRTSAIGPFPSGFSITRAVKLQAGQHTISARVDHIFGAAFGLNAGLTVQELDDD